jgi:hypothetical protein
MRSEHCGWLHSSGGQLPVPSALYTKLQQKSGALCGLFSAMLRCRPWRASARLRPPPCRTKTSLADCILIFVAASYHAQTYSALFHCIYYKELPEKSKGKGLIRIAILRLSHYNKCEFCPKQIFGGKKDGI